MQRIALAMSLFLVFVLNTANANSIEVTPNAYTFDQAPNGIAQGGIYNYFDETGNQLTDNNYGVEPWFANASSNGPAYEWVGWFAKPLVNIDFSFNQAQQIDKIEIGSIQNNLSDVVLPSINIYSSSNGTNWSLVTSLVVPEATANDNLYRKFAFDNLALTAQYLRVSLNQSLDGPWTFVDEVDFYQNTVPTPSVLSLFGIGLLVFRAVKNRK